MSALVFLLTQASMALFGIAFAFHPAVRSRGWAVRSSLAFLGGSVLFTASATLLSLAGFSWGERTLPMPLIVASIVLIRRWRRQPATPPPAPFRPNRRVLRLFSPVMLLAVLHLAASAWFGLMTSPDYLFFWGVKAVRYAAVRGIDLELLRSAFGAHTHVTYPQLFPVTLSWSALFLGANFWHVATLSAPLWVIAALPVIGSLVRRVLDDDGTMATMTLWTVAIACSLVASRSGGNAEAPLIVYGTVALLALMLEQPGGDPARLRLFAVVGLAGMLMTKEEGAIGFVLLATGWVLRGRSRRAGLGRRGAAIFLPPLGFAATWWLYQLIKKTPLSDATREKALAIHFDHLSDLVLGVLRNAGAGTFGLSWLLPLAFLAVAWRRWGRVIPALVQLFGTLGFLFVYYLHAKGSPEMIIDWTMSRVSQPALSALVLAASLLHFAPRGPLAPVAD